MARVTVEDCIEKVSNRFELVMLAAQRARRIGSGAALTVDRDNDKNPVVALREIAESTVNTSDLKEELTRSHQRIVAYEEEEENIDLMDGEAEWGTIVAQSAATNNEFIGINDDEDDEDEEDEPSLEDLAGNPADE